MSIITKPVGYTLNSEDTERFIIITPVIKNKPEDDMFVTGVYKLSEGETGLGDIVFDDDMNQWEYTGMGDLTHKEAGQIAEFIRSYQSPYPV